MKYLYVTGMRRSGTTMLANFLNSQDKITIYRDYINTLRTAVVNENPTLDEFSNDREKNIVLSNMYADALTMASIDLNIDKDSIRNIYDVYKLALNSIAEHDDLVVGNKCTESLLVLEKLLKRADVFGLYILRDVRDVIFSTKNRFFDKDINERVHTWKSELNHAKKLQQNFPERFLIVRYEDFVQKNNKEALEKFLGLKINWDIKVFKDRMGIDFSPNSSFFDINKGEGLSPKGLHRWKNDNNIIDSLVAEIICKDELREFGYEITAPERVKDLFEN